MRSLRSLRPSPALAVAFLALFVALSGSALAVKVATKNSVATKSIRTGAVTSDKLRAGAVTAAKVAPESLTGAQIDEGTLTGAKSENVYGAAFDVSLPCCSGQVVRKTHPAIASDGCGPSSCGVIFPRDLSDCVLTATGTNAEHTGSTGAPVILEARLLPSEHSQVNVDMWDTAGFATLHDFALTVVCP